MVETTKGILDKGSKAGTISSPIGILVGLEVSTRDMTRHARKVALRKDLLLDIEKDSFPHEMTLHVRVLAAFSFLNRK